MAGFQCPVCYEEFSDEDRNPMVLDCFHVHCPNCIDIVDGKACCSACFKFTTIESVDLLQKALVADLVFDSESRLSVRKIHGDISSKNNIRSNEQDVIVCLKENCAEAVEYQVWQNMFRASRNLFIALSRSSRGRRIL